MPTLREGDRISNYLLERRLGAGSFGEVWRARHHVFGDAVAIKIPTDPQYVRNLQREGVAVHGLRHPNIVRAIDLDPYADPSYLVMELVDGPSLRTVIDRFKSGVPIEAAVRIMRGILHALTAAHEHELIHRDLKPANILLHNVGCGATSSPDDTDDLASLDFEKVTEQCVKVTDFGLGEVGGSVTRSILQSGSLLTGDGRSIAGTIAYMSPEQREGRPLDARSDLYACGIILFEMLTGERPHGSEKPSTLRATVPSFLDDVFLRSYARWDRRFGCALDMLEAMTPVRRNGVTTAYGQPPPPPLGAPTARRCIACAQEVEPADQFCIHCGRQLMDSIPRCRACQAFVHPSDRFCILCGNDLRVLYRG